MNMEHKDTFRVAGDNKQYRDNYDEIFRKERQKQTETKKEGGK